MCGLDHLWLPLADIIIGWTAGAIDATISAEEYLLTEDVLEQFSWSRGADRLRHGYARDPHLIRRIVSGDYPPHAMGCKTPSLVWFWLALYRAWAHRQALSVAWSPAPPPLPQTGSPPNHPRFESSVPMAPRAWLAKRTQSDRGDFGVHINDQNTPP